jgi:preprotein translocase subunit SecE
LNKEGWGSLKIYMANKLTNYIKGSVEEMKKVTWPTKKETKNFTLLVIGISVGVAIFLGALDYIFSFALELLLNR